MSEKVQGGRGMLEASREAMRQHDWEEARRLLSRADGEGSLDGEGLRLLGKARDWCGDPTGSRDAFERAYAAFVAAGDRRGAAKLALMLRHLCANTLGDAAAARGWVRRAEHLLEGQPECIEHGFLWRAQGRRAFIEGRLEEGRVLLEKAIDLGNRLGNSNLVAMSRSILGISLGHVGRLDEAYALLDEACAAAIGGELGPWATGIVYCNTIGVYRDAGEFAMGSEWTETAGRWCRRESITGFAGICRVHRAEFMRLRGAWADAEREARQASDELEYASAWAGDGHYEVGEIRLRMGDLAGAEDAFRRAHELGREPQPGAALLLAAQGQPAAALRSLETALTAGQASVLDEMRCLAAKVNLACEVGQADVASSAAQRAEELSAGQHGLGLQVLGVQARGTVQLAQGDVEAHKTLRRAVRIWQEIDAPYEVAQARLLLARALRQSGDEVGARRECGAALAAFERLGAGPDAERARTLRDVPPIPPTQPTAKTTQRTLFFSDIVGSTQLVQAIGDEAWSALVAWLDTAMRECFAHHGGEEVDHAGDGFFVAFPDAISALDCAITIQRRLADHRRDHGFAPKVRMGVHATSASQTGGSYRGRGVHEASRIAALAGPDEIVASRRTVPAGIPMSRPRKVTVKGISEPLEVVTVEWTR